MKIEVAVDEYQHAAQAQRHGADRIELCDNLHQGGTTPSYGLIKYCTETLDIQAHVMIRCRPGDFYFDNEEIDMMMYDIKAVADIDAKGVVFGVLDHLAEFNYEANAKLIEHAQRLGLKTTFHRAFDVCEEPDQAFRQMIKLGFDYVLTSGRAPTAADGLIYIKSMVKKAKGRIKIIAGKGVIPENADAIMKSGVDSIHFTCRTDFPEMATDGMTEGSGYIFDTKKYTNIHHKRNLFVNAKLMK